MAQAQIERLLLLGRICDCAQQELQLDVRRRRMSESRQWEKDCSKAEVEEKKSRCAVKNASKCFTQAEVDGWMCRVGVGRHQAREM